MSFPMVICLICAVCTQISGNKVLEEIENREVKISNVKATIDKAKEIFDMFKEESKVWDISTISKSIGLVAPWIEVGIPLFGALLGEFVGSPVMVEIKNGFKKLNEELKSVTRKIESTMENVVHAHSAMMNMMVDQDIMIANDQLLVILNQISHESRQAEIKNFLKIYRKRGEGRSLATLYSTLIERTIPNLYSVAHGDCEDFVKSGRIMKNMLFLGIQNHIAALVFEKASEKILEEAVQEWNHNIKHVSTMIDHRFKKCKIKLHKGIVELMNEILGKKMNTKKIAKTLGETLNSTYGFMNWISLVYQLTDLEIKDGVNGTAVYESDLIKGRRAIVGFIHKTEKYDSDLKCDNLKTYVKDLYERSDAQTVSTSVLNSGLACNSVVIELKRTKKLLVIKYKGGIDVLSSSTLPEDKLCTFKDSQPEPRYEAWFF